MQNNSGFDIPPGVPYCTIVMNTRSATSSLFAASGAPTGATGGLYAFARFYLGYAYFYVYPSTAGGV